MDKKVILISGGSDGLGKALAASLAKQHDVIILANRPEETAAAAAAAGCDYVVADVTDASALVAAVVEVLAKHGHVDCLVNNAGIYLEGPFEDADPVRIKAVMEVNTLGTMYLTRAVLPAMKAARAGRIVNVVSQAGLYARAGYPVYSASKWAITGFTKSLAEELKPTGITVCGFYPGPMKTKIFEKAGVEEDMSGFIELADAVRALEFIIETPDALAIPELGINPGYY